MRTTRKTKARAAAKRARAIDPLDTFVVAAPPDPVAQLLARAKACPMTPELVQLMAAVEYVRAGHPIRAGSPHSMASRIARLQALVDAS
jgi:hypothetical protein